MPIIPIQPSDKHNEWEKKSIIIGAFGGLNAVMWGILISYWLGLT